MHARKRKLWLFVAESVQLGADQPDGAGHASAVRGVVQPAAGAGRVGEWDRSRALVLVAAADALGHALQAQEAAGCQAPDGDDQPRAEELELPVAPERAEHLLARRRRAVTAAARRLAGIAARDRRAVERLVELVLVELEPAAEGAARAAPPRQAAGLFPPRAPHRRGLDSFLPPRRLPEDVRTLAAIGLDDRERLEREARLDARPADAVVPLQRRERAVARAPARQERTATNQWPAKRISPPPSSAARSSAVK